MCTLLLYVGRESLLDSMNHSVRGIVFSAMARQMGLGPEDLKQMGSMWKNMDDLAATDPDTYKKFTADIIAEGPPEEGSQKAKSFLPTPGFVVKTKTTASGGRDLKVNTLHGPKKYFINMTCCDALEPPKDHYGRPVEVRAWVVRGVHISCGFVPQKKIDPLTPYAHTDDDAGDIFYLVLKLFHGGVGARQAQR
jgi:hypothetical protein